MKQSSPKIFFILLGIALAASFARAQSAPAASPYAVGETLTYEGKVSKVFVRGISVANINFAVAEAPNKRDYIVNAEAVSKGSLLSLFKFKFLEKFSSTVDAKTFSILRSVKRDEQGNRVREGEAIFDYQAKKVIYVENDPNDAARPPFRVASVIENDTYDLVSAIYALRRLPLAVGRTFTLNVSDSGLVYKIPVRVAERQAQNTLLGKTVCYRLEPDIFGDGRMIEQKGRMSIWITDDARRLPVRASINTELRGIAFDLEIRLRRIEMKKV